MYDNPNEPIRWPDNGKQNVILAVDVHGWAFHNNARNVARYLRDDFNIAIMPYQRVAPGTECDTLICYWWPSFLELESKIEFRHAWAGIRDEFSFRKREFAGHFRRLLGSTIDGFWCCNPRVLAAVKEKTKKPCHLIMNGVDLDLFTPQPFPDEFTVGWAGNPDIHNTIKNYALVRDACNAVQVPLVCADGSIPYEEMTEKFYSRISCLILASTSEGTSNPVLEAMACGKPVIASRVGIVPEVMGRSGLAGYIVDEITVKSFAQSIAHMRKGPLKRWGVRARSHVRGWSWHFIANQYRKLLGEHRRRVLVTSYFSNTPDNISDGVMMSAEQALASPEFAAKISTVGMAWANPPRPLILSTDNPQDVAWVTNEFRPHGVLMKGSWNHLQRWSEIAEASSAHKFIYLPFWGDISAHDPKRKVFNDNCTIMTPVMGYDKWLREERGINAVHMHYGVEKLEAEQEHADIAALQASGRFVLAYFGRMGIYKQIPDFVEQFKRVKEIVPNAHLWLAGLAEGGDKITDLIKSHGLKDVTYHRRAVSRTEIGQIFKTADCLVFPSFRETYGIVNLEAMRAGCPVVTWGAEWPIDTKDGVGYTPSMIEFADYPWNAGVFRGDWQPFLDMIADVADEPMVSRQRAQDYQPKLAHLDPSVVMLRLSEFIRSNTLGE